MIAFRIPLQLAWAIATPLLFGVVRLVQGGFAPDFRVPVALDVSFALILGGVMLTLGWVFRSVAANVDETRARAVASYARAAAADAFEEERIAVAGLMHDSVLAALIAAERASTPRERDLAVGMAREALTRLANAEGGGEEGSDEPVSRDSIADGVERAAHDLGVDLAVLRVGDRRQARRARTRGPGPGARRDAGRRERGAARGRGRPRRIGLRRRRHGRRVQVRDDGPGVDMETSRRTASASAHRSSPGWRPSAGSPTSSRPAPARS